jgi:hypothetical protein
VDHGVAAPDKLAQHRRQRAVSQGEIAFLDWEDLERKQRVFDLAAKTAQVRAQGLFPDRQCTLIQWLGTTSPRAIEGATCRRIR